LFSSRRNYNRGQEVAKTTENGCNEVNDAAVAAPADDDNSDDLPLSEWVHKEDCDILASYDLDAYVSIDSDIVTAKTQTEKNIAMEVKIKQTNEPEEEVMIKKLKWRFLL
jgi:hypothetical protein